MNRDSPFLNVLFWIIIVLILILPVLVDWEYFKAHWILYVIIYLWVGCGFWGADFLNAEYRFGGSRWYAPKFNFIWVALGIITLIIVFVKLWRRIQRYK